MTLRPISLALLTVLVLGGCSSSARPGDITAKYDSATRKIPSERRVTQAGVYELVETTTGRVMHQARMVAGAYHGFRMGPDEVVVGFSQELDASGGFRDTVVRIDDAGDRAYAWRIVSLDPR